MSAEAIPKSSTFTTCRGLIITFLGAMAYSGLYLLSDRNLLIPILAHGIENTVGFMLIFMGRYPGL